MSNPFSEPTAQNPYTSSASYQPALPAGPPGVIFWFKAFCGVMALGCFGVAGFSVLTLIVMSNPNVLPPDVASDVNSIRAVYGVLLAFALLGAVLYLIFPALRKSPATWIYGMVLLGLSLITLCGALPAILLIIYWSMEPTRRYYGVAS